MSDILQASLQLTSVDEKITGKKKTPIDVCNSLFRDLLKKNSNSSPDDGSGLSLYTEAGENRRALENESIKGVSPLKS